jgi:hypothetical protein
LSNCTALQEILLSGNSIDGDVETALEIMSSIPRIHLNHNRITGALPTSQAFWESLMAKQLLLKNNMIQGSIPTFIGLSSIEDLILGDNRITGSIPSEIGSMQDIVRLALNGNQLNSTIPTEITQAPMLSILYLHNNDLEGSIPTETWTHDLAIFSVDGNPLLNQTIPSSICNARPETYVTCGREILANNRRCECCTYCCEFRMGPPTNVAPELYFVENDEKDDNGMNVCTFEGASSTDPVTDRSKDQISAPLNENDGTSAGTSSSELGNGGTENVDGVNGSFGNVYGGNGDGGGSSGSGGGDGSGDGRGGDGRGGGGQFQNVPRSRWLRGTRFVTERKILNKTGACP